MSVAINLQAASPEQTQKLPRGFYHPELDVLRFGAFLAVFIDHVIPQTPDLYVSHGIPHFVAAFIVNAVSSGRFGVMLFFLLSSYLITALLLREHAVRGRLDLRSFYIRRALRIWPLYFFFIALCFWVMPAVTLGWPQISNVHKVSFALFVANWSIVFFGPPHTPAIVLWSVSVEEQFYIFWPLVLVVFGCNQLRRLAYILLAIATLTRLALIPFHLPNSSIWPNTFVELDPIAIGALLAWLFRNSPPSFPFSLRMLLLFVGMALPMTALFYFGLTGWGILATGPLVTAGAGMVLVAVLTDSPSTWLRAGPLVYLGKISYGLYVFHMLMFGLAQKIAPDSRLIAILIALLGTVAIAAISYQLLERPFLRLKERFTHVVSRPA
ncbi:MAG TPA: acyltransferase [Lacunisphaera sp.]|jgi:peptidoglycan/LPS O-acetylase OafA/YrhL